MVCSTQLVETPAYVAPEVISRKGYDGAKADIWSCGVILYVLLAGYLPFHDANLISLYRKISKAEYKFPNWFSSEVRKLVSKMLDPNPNKKELGKPTSLNAFDIISLSNGLDFSGFFDKSHQEKQTKFTSMHSASTIITKLEDTAKNLQLEVKKKDGGLLKLEGSEKGRKGALSIEAEVFEFTPSFHLVEVKKSSGDTLEYTQVLEQGLRPALKDIVWAWQGEKHEQQEEQKNAHSS
ncbi:hypothetical protein GH714_014197 [Hevea brasiliensis]|uniref:non-specific serine/threonine protein kinase n=1 Tax=Hevea brasiliensis TaxID=3981 RepID=A0A6A6N438_HEVBR|nr:hypothetical protein GH714_014197 [Hevea brasiliensis]